MSSSPGEAWAPGLALELDLLVIAPVDMEVFLGDPVLVEAGLHATFKSLEPKQAAVWWFQQGSRQEGVQPERKTSLQLGPPGRTQ